MLGSRILIKPDPSKTTEIITPGGLVASTGAKLTSSEGGRNDRFDSAEIPTGKVIAVGPDVKTLSPGDRVLYSPFSGKVLTFQLEDYLLMSEPEPVMKIND